MANLHELQAATASFTEISGLSAPLSFGNDAIALKCARAAVALYDCCHWGRIQMLGDDRLRFLHNQTTNDFNSRQPGEGCDTVFVTSTARTIDLASVYLLEDAVLLLVSANRRQKLLEWMDRYLFPADRVELRDITSSTFSFSLIGPTSDAILTQLGGQLLQAQPTGSHTLMSLAGNTVRVAVGSGLALSGYTLIGDREQAGSLWQALTTAGAVPMGEQAWEQLRIQQGRPKPEQELTEDYNPLEAGLWHSISFSKGCYIGQETIARLQTYQGVKRQLWGLRLNGPAEPNSIITLAGEKVGKLTSVTPTIDGWFGLAYIRTKAGGDNLQVQVGDTQGEVVEVPFLTRGDA
jgi:hypothetical protein